MTGGDRLSFEKLSENRENNSNSNQGNKASSTGVNSAGGESVATEGNSSSESRIRSVPRQPFAKVDRIASESPAEEAGMKVGDLVTLFGSVNANNHNRLRALAKLVPEVAGQGGTIQLVVLRSRTDGIQNMDYEDETKWETHTLSLRPRPFSGRGLLGCRRRAALRRPAPPGARERP